MPHPCYFRVTVCFFFNNPATTEIYTLSLHDALPISFLPCLGHARWTCGLEQRLPTLHPSLRSEEHTSELQSHVNLVCRLLLEIQRPQTRYTVPGQTPLPGCLSVTPCGPG